jgi:DNA-binding NarL/FixJ family response regulator
VAIALAMGSFTPPTKMSVRILLADDHTIVRQAIKVALELEGFKEVVEASDGREAINHCKHLHPDVAIIDISMPRLNGIEAAREILKTCPNTKVVMLSEHKADRYVLESLQVGVHGYVLKAETAAELAHAIFAVSKGQAYVSPGVFQALKAYQAGVEPAGLLSVRESEVLQLIAEGNSTKEIADALKMSYKTVRSHRDNIMKKLDVHSTVDLVLYSIRRGLLEA